LAQLAATDATTSSSSAISSGIQQQLEPHFGSRLAAQVLQRAEQAVQQQVPSFRLPEVPQLPSTLPSQLPAVELPSFTAPTQLPAVHFPSVQLPQVPQVQLPSFDAPNVQFPDSSSALDSINSAISSSTTAAFNAADALMHLPQQTQQELQLLLTQLQELNSSNSALEPHFGSHALLSWLQAAAASLSSSLQSAAGSLHVPAIPALDARGMDISSGSAVLGSMSSSILGSVSNTLSTQGFAGMSASAKDSADALAASLQVLSASVSAALPADVSSGLSQGTHSVQQQAAALAGSVQQLQGLLVQFGHTLQHLPETGAGGYSFSTLCLIAAGTLAAVAASIPPADAVAGGKDEGLRDVMLTHEYDPAAVEAYFRRRPVQVAQRSLQLAMELAGFGLSLLGDLATSRLQVRAVAGPGHAFAWACLCCLRDRL
jgi:aarF domain-containing kinase